MQFKTDENIHPDVAVMLRSAGHDTATVWDQNLRGGADDSLAAICRAEGRAFITFDLDFANTRNYPPQDYPGIVVCRFGSQSRPHVTRVFARLLPLLDALPLAKHLWIVDETSVRVRGSD